MQVKEIMTPNPEMIPMDATLMDAALKMKDLDVGVIPVRQDNSLVGLVTDRDIVIRAIAEKRDPVKTEVKDIMSRKILTCPESTDVQDAVHTMETNKVRRLIITDTSGNPVGIVSLGDIAVKSAGEKGLAGEALSKVSQPSHPER